MFADDNNHKIIDFIGLPFNVVFHGMWFCWYLSFEDCVGFYVIVFFRGCVVRIILCRFSSTLTICCRFNWMVFLIFVVWILCRFLYETTGCCFTNLGRFSSQSCLLFTVVFKGYCFPRICRFEDYVVFCITVFSRMSFHKSVSFF